ncbi:MAG: UDP-N-acetylglucosamine 2-epimerase [Legionellales bacterium]
MKRKLCVVTATRAEYGLLKCLLDEIIADSALELQLIVTGSHLSPEFGYTIKQIREDGYPVTKAIEMLLSSDTPIGISKSMGLAQIGFAEAYSELKPDLVLVLGDRYELIPIVVAAVLCNIPVAHLNGGEVTQGSMDEVFRHTLTKLSTLHFTAMQEYAERVVRMGEQPSRVFNVGEAGLDSLQSFDFMTKPELEASLGMPLKRRNFLITLHPETAEAATDVEMQCNHLLRVLDEQDDSLLIFTKANADVGGRIINAMIEHYVAQHADKALVFVSLGQRRYWSLLRMVDAVVGNSSSGIVEAPSFQIGSINVGTRQQGRLRAASVIDADFTLESLRASFARLTSAAFAQQLPGIINPYRQNNSSAQIKTILRDIDLSLLKNKIFYDGAL